jgi:hypothetical protein
MGECYNKGWSVRDTNRLAFIIRQYFPKYSLSKDSLKVFVNKCKKIDFRMYMPNLSDEDFHFIRGLP